MSFIRSTHNIKHYTSQPARTQTHKSSNKFRCVLPYNMSFVVYHLYLASRLTVDIRQFGQLLSNNVMSLCT